MAEQVIIDIELKGFSDAKKNLDELTKAQIAQQEIVKQNKQEIRDYEKAIRELEEAQKEGKELTETETELLSLYNQNLQTARENLAANKDELSNVNSERRAAVKEVDTYNTALNAEIGSNEQLRAQLKILTQEYDGLSQEQRENSDEGKVLTDQIKGLTDKLKENESAIGDNRRNVGNYEEAITNALDKVEIMGVNVGGLTKQVMAGIAQGKGYATSILSVAGASQAAGTSTGIFSNALRVLRVALISTGIGAVVVAIGAMIAAVSKFQPLMDRVSVVLAQVGQVVNVLVDRFAMFGKGLISILSGNPAKGFNEIKESASGLGDELEREIELAGRLKQQFIELERSQVILNAALTSARARIKELENVYNDTTASLEEKNAAIKEAIKLQNDITKAQEDEQKRLIANAFGYEQYNDKVANLVNSVLDMDNIYKSTEERLRIFNLTMKNLGLDISDADETTETITGSIAKLAQISLDGETALKRLGSQAKSLGLQINKTSLQAAMDIEKLNKKIQELAEQSRIDQLSDFEKEKSDIKNKYDEQIKLAIEYFGEESQQVKTLTDLRNAEILNAERKNQLELENIKKQYLQSFIEDDKEALEQKLINLEFEKNKELAIESLSNEERLAIEEKFQADKAAIQLEALQEQAEKLRRELEPLMADASGGLIEPLTPEEEAILKKQLNAINSEIQKVKSTLKGEGEEEDSTGTEMINVLGLDEEGMENLMFAFSTVRNSISAIGGLMNSVAERNKKALQKQVEDGVITQEQADKRLEQIEKKAFIRQKALQLAGAVQNTAQAVVSTLAQEPGGIIKKGVAAAIAGALGAVQIATIAATKYEEGGLIKGASHSQGGVPFTVRGKGGFEAEGGEYIVRKSAVDSYGVGFLEALNNMQLPKMFAEGGYIPPVPSGSISEQVSQGVSELVSVSKSQQIEVINVEENFSKLQTKVNNIEQARTY